MLVTITEMGDRKYVIYVRRKGRHRTFTMSPALRSAIIQRGQRLWQTNDFGQGKVGQQAQYYIPAQKGDPALCNRN
jgi:hypothetical protein